MAAIDFPNTPEVDDEFTVGSVTYVWDGDVWNSIGLAIAGPAGADGAAGADGVAIADYPLEYNSGTKTISLDEQGISSIQDNHVMSIMGAV
jgi:hypothetical protein